MTSSRRTSAYANRRATEPSTSSSSTSRSPRRALPRISAGTPPYLDPFLGTGTRQHWDSAAERYAAAVTLFEMATGHAPVYGDGETAPQFVERATIEPGDFDATVADSLVRFFETAFAKDAKQRHGTAADMLADWRNALAASVATTPEDADEVAERATPDTLLPQSGLTPRALSALEPFRLKTVGDLAALDTSRLSRFTGIVDATKREIRGRAKQWREKFADELPATSVADRETSTKPTRSPPQKSRRSCSSRRQGAHARRHGVRRPRCCSGWRAMSSPSPFLRTSPRRSDSAVSRRSRPRWRRSATPGRSQLKRPHFSTASSIAWSVCWTDFDGAAWTDVACRRARARRRDQPHAASTDRWDGARRSRPRRRQGQGRRRGVADRPPTSSPGQPTSACALSRGRRRGWSTRARATQLVDDAVEGGEFVVPRGRSVPAFSQTLGERTAVARRHAT